MYFFIVFNYIMKLFVFVTCKLRIEKYVGNVKENVNAHFVSLLFCFKDCFIIMSSRNFNKCHLNFENENKIIFW